MPAPEALKIQEAIDNVIKMTDVPNEGATALIPKPPNVDKDDLIQVLIADKVVAEKHDIGEPVDGFFKVLVPRLPLLENVGPQGAEFKYIYWLGGTNNWVSEPITYEVRHS